MEMLKWGFKLLPTVPVIVFLLKLPFKVIWFGVEKADEYFRMNKKLEQSIWQLEDKVLEKVFNQMSLAR